MDSSFIITFVSDDRPGLVEALSSTIESKGGNWHESRLSQLGGKFAGLISVSLPADAGTELETALEALATGGISVTVKRASEVSEPAAPGQDVCLTIVGPDRTGIVKEISRALSERKINVVEMHSQVASAPMSGEMLFHARVDARVPEATDIAELSDTLDEIANQMTLDIELD
ncbi:MAG: ACT domain-containing protein [Pseudomonadota bacterium]